MKWILLTILLTVSTLSMASEGSQVIDNSSGQENIEYWILSTDIQSDSQFIKEMAKES